MCKRCCWKVLLAFRVWSFTDTCHPVGHWRYCHAYYSYVTMGRWRLKSPIHVCLLNRLFRRRSKKTAKLHFTGLCVGNSPVTCEFPAQMASKAENVSIWWRHHADDVVQINFVIGQFGQYHSCCWLRFLASPSHQLLRYWHCRINAPLSFTKNDFNPYHFLTEWGQVTHINVGNLTIIDSDNGFSHRRRQAIIWAISGILLIGHLGTKNCGILITIPAFSFMKMHLNMCTKWRPICLSLNMLISANDSKCKYDFTFPHNDSTCKCLRVR